MHCPLNQSSRFPSRALARLFSSLTPRVLRALRLSAFGLCCLVLPARILAGEVTIAWDPPQDASAAGYRIYYGSGSSGYEGVLEVGMDTTYTMTDLAEGQAYYFALVAYDADGVESQLSQEVPHNGPARDAEVDDEANDLLDAPEADPAEADSEPDGEDSDEIDAEELDTMPDFAQDAEVDQDQDHDRPEASSELHVVPHSALRIVSVDSETLVGDGAADSAIDGRVETFWQTARGARASVPPHELVIALGGEHMVSGFRYLPRQDGRTDGMVGRYSFYVSADGQAWGKAVTTGTFSRDIGEQEVMFPGQEGSFVRFVAHTEMNGKSSTSVAEITVVAVR
jgi:hypothetical protein